MLVATIGLSLSIHISLEWFLGDWLVHFLSFWQNSELFPNSHFLRPAKYHLKIWFLLSLFLATFFFCNDGNKSYLIQFAGPTIKIFLSVPLPLVSSLLATVKATAFAFFPWTSRAQRHHLPEHSSTQFFRVSQMIWNRFFCCFWMLLATFSIFHAICWDIFFWIFLPFSKLFLCFGH